MALGVDPWHTRGHFSEIKATYNLGMGQLRKAKEAIAKDAEIFHTCPASG